MSLYKICMFVQVFVSVATEEENERKRTAKHNTREIHAHKSGNEQKEMIRTMEVCFSSTFCFISKSIKCDG